MKKIKSGPLKGKRIKIASQDRVENTWDIAEHFMRHIYDMDANDCLITDQSTLGDFRGVNDLEEVADMKAKIQEVYGITPSSVYLADIFEQIQQSSK